MERWQYSHLPWWVDVRIRNRAWGVNFWSLTLWIGLFCLSLKWELKGIQLLFSVKTICSFIFDSIRIGLRNPWLWGKITCYEFKSLLCFLVVMQTCGYALPLWATINPSGFKITLLWPLYSLVYISEQATPCLYLLLTWELVLFWFRQSNCSSWLPFTLLFLGVTILSTSFQKSLWTGGRRSSLPLLLPLLL